MAVLVVVLVDDFAPADVADGGFVLVDPAGNGPAAVWGQSPSRRVRAGRRRGKQPQKAVTFQFLSRHHRRRLNLTARLSQLCRHCCHDDDKVPDGLQDNFSSFSKYLLLTLLKAGAKCGYRMEM